jgi:hypothetical protein
MPGDYNPADCVDDCALNECGYDCLGDTCGSCESASLCIDGRCIQTGEVAVTLRWNTAHNLDLVVTNPLGEFLSKANEWTTEGGVLGAQSHALCMLTETPGIEHVYWPLGSALPGSYSVSIIVEDGCEAADNGEFEIEIISKGSSASHVLPIPESNSQDQKSAVHITSFIVSPEPCVPSCTPGACGTDGCGGSCGSCDTIRYCAPHLALDPICLPEPEEVDSGDDCTLDECGLEQCIDDPVCADTSEEDAPTLQCTIDDCHDLKCVNSPVCKAESVQSIGEVCDNGMDDDLDQAIDCNDSDCAKDAACVSGTAKIEQCGNGIDDDDNGLVDCADKHCANATPCTTQSCSTYYGCLAEQGCTCALGADCPEPGTDAFSQCQLVCYKDTPCEASCEDALPGAFQKNLVSYKTCAEDECSLSETLDEYYECMTANCTPETAECFYTGASDCADFYFFCAPECGLDEECMDFCADELSPTGYKDAVTWDSCRLELCDLDADGTLDSEACYYTGSFFGCSAAAGTCMPDQSLQGMGNCVSVAQCVAACDTLSNAACVTSCLELVGESDTPEIEALFQCGISYCGSGESALTPSCLWNAFTNVCIPEWSTCQGS